MPLTQEQIAALAWALRLEDRAAFDRATARMADSDDAYGALQLWKCLDESSLDALVKAYVVSLKG